MTDISHLLGKIHHSDALEFMRGMPDKSVDLCLTDPPYNIGKPQLITDMRCKDKRKVGQDFSHFEMLIFPDEWIPEVARILNPEGVLISFYNDRRFEEILLAVKKCMEVIQIGVWHKTNPPVAMRAVGFQFAHELFVVAKCPGASHYYDISNGQQHSVFQYPICGGYERLEHPTQKPLKLIRKLVRLFTKENAVVLDPFCGVATTAVACEQLNRQWLCCDNHLPYVEIARARIACESQQLSMFTARSAT